MRSIQKNPYQPKPVLVLNLAHQNLLSISDQGRGRGVMEHLPWGNAESGCVAKTAKKRGPQMHSLGFLVEAVTSDAAYSVG